MKRRFTVVPKSPESAPTFLLRVLGPPELECDGTPVALSTRKAAAVLAFLALQPQRAQTRDKLAALLWSDAGPEQARQSLRQTIFAIRHLAPEDGEVDPLVTDSDRVMINPGTVRVDAHEFEELANRDDRVSLETAALLYRGELLEGFHVDEAPFDNWLRAEGERLRQLALSVLSRLVAMKATAHDTHGAIMAALRLLAIEPTHEATHRDLMRLFMTQGRKDAAARQYQMCSDQLFASMRVSPSSETTRLYHEILESTGHVAAPTPSAIPSPSTPSHSRRREDSESANRPLTVLLIEDESVSRLAIGAMLESADMKVITSNDGGQALLLLGRHPIDLILLDLSMPRLSGFDVLEILRENESQVPVIVLTGETGHEAELRSLEMGAVDFIHKPVNRAVLLKRIENAIK